MVKRVHNWPSDLPVQNCVWDDVPQNTTIRGVFSGSIYRGMAVPRARVTLTGAIVDHRQYAGWNVLQSRLEGGENLMLLPDHNRVAYTYDPYYQAPPAGIQGTVTWQDGAGTDYNWTDGVSNFVWLAGMNIVSGGAQGSATITLGGLQPGTVLQKGHKIFIVDRRYTITQNYTADGVGEVTLVVAPRFRPGLSGSERVIYPGDVGLFSLVGLSAPRLNQYGYGVWSLQFVEVFEYEYSLYGGLIYV